MLDDKERLELEELVEGSFVSDTNIARAYEVIANAVKMGLDFKTSKKGKPVVNYREQREIMRSLLEPIPEEGMPMERVMREFRSKILNGSVNFSSPNFMAFPDCGNSLAAITGHVLSGMLNQNLINSVHTSPTATFAEMAVINWLRELVGYNVKAKPKSIADVGGINVTGGVSANTIGLLLARENRFPGTLTRGLSYDPKKIKVFLPKGIGHYSIKGALGWMGLGMDNAVEVDTTPGFTIDKHDLVARIKKCDKDDVLLALVSYTGDSRTMAIDDFRGLHRIADDYGMWMHVDACHGLSLCFSDKLKHKVRGIELADSVTIDPHKVLYVPYPLSYVLAKDPKKFDLVSGVSDLITQEPFSFGQITPLFGSRAFNSLKLWFLVKNLGRKNIGKLIDERHERVKYFAGLVDRTEDFYMMNEVTINSAAYLYVPGSLKDRLHTPKREEAVAAINDLNKNIQLRIFKEGQYYVHTFKLNDFRNVMQTGTDTVFQMQRLMLGNPLTTRQVLNEFMRYSQTVAQEEAAKRGYRK